MRPRVIVLFISLAFLILSLVPASVQAKSLHNGRTKSSPFSLALETLQKQINYKFERIDLLRRAMTHSSFSEENNKALSILGANVIEASVSLYSLTNDIDLSAKSLNRRIAEVSNVDKSCAVDGLHLGLQKIVRVSSKTNVTAPALLCASFRAIFGAIAVDKGSSDEAGNVFVDVHGGGSGKAAVAIIIVTQLGALALAELPNKHQKIWHFIHLSGVGLGESASQMCLQPSCSTFASDA